jgi:hypothetical protein
VLDYEEAIVFLLKEHGWHQRGSKICYNSGSMSMALERGIQINFWAEPTRTGLTVYFPDKDPHIIQVMPIRYKYATWVYDHYGSWRTDFRGGIEVNLMHPTSLEELSEYVDNLMMSRMDWFEKLGFKIMRWWSRRV